MSCKNEAQSNSNLPQGVLLHSLKQHEDERGILIEIFRNEWNAGIKPIQWNTVFSKAGVLRGVHVHTGNIANITQDRMIHASVLSSLLI